MTGVVERAYYRVVDGKMNMRRKRRESFCPFSSHIT